MLSLSYPVRSTVTLDPSGVRSCATIYLSNRYPVKFYRCHFIPFTPSNSKLLVWTSSTNCLHPHNLPKQAWFSFNTPNYAWNDCICKNEYFPVLVISGTELLVVRISYDPSKFSIEPYFAACTAELDRHYYESDTVTQHATGQLLNRYVLTWTTQSICSHMNSTAITL